MTLLIDYLKPLRKRMLLGFSVKFTGTIMDLFLPWILAYMIDVIVPTENINRVMLWGWSDGHLFGNSSAREY